MPRILLTPEQKLANKRESNRRWAEANPQKVVASQAKYAASNKEKIAAYKALARKLQPAKFRARSARWRAENADKCHERSAKVYRENKEAFITQIAGWRAANKERLAECVSATKKSAKFLARRRAYGRRRHATNVQARIATLIRNRLRKAVRGERPARALDAIGCSVPEAIAHIEKQFQDGMSWGNHGDWHIDHVRPLASFDLTDSEQFNRACHFTNLQPLWRRENQEKGSKY